MKEIDYVQEMSVKDMERINGGGLRELVVITTIFMYKFHKDVQDYFKGVYDGLTK